MVIRIPHTENRELHLSIFKRVENFFILGIFGAYWDSYDVIRLSVFPGLNILKDVWEYHCYIVDVIYDGEYSAGYQPLADHADLLRDRPSTSKDWSYGDNKLKGKDY